MVAFVCIKSQQSLLTSDDAEAVLRKHVADLIGAVARPRNVYIVDELPKTRSGKIMRRLLKQIAEGKEVGDTTTLADTMAITAIQQQVSSSLQK